MRTGLIDHDLLPLGLGSKVRLHWLLPEVRRVRKKRTQTFMCPFYIHVWSCIIRVQTAMQLQRNLGLRLSGADRANVWQLVPDKDEPANGTDINAGIGKKGVSFFLVPSKE
jgi:hypothetical protein